ncbi:ECF transporter S component [Microbacterium sp. lyk4-40-TSB-66]|uniref:ECF transporter S component n=1 Tax=Microbacterium sp. lyk4-40-TSB-66 TaxID=3040294 RepID=UPI002551AB03|nr:ECF transporter S component [Microbacterium sp. lyk4-40-TSB-66]
MHTSTSARTAPAVATVDRFRWRVVDIVVAAVLGVAVGLVFFGWNTVGGLWFEGMDALTPGLGGLAVGIWLIGGVIGGLVIRKPGAALLVELIAAVVSALIGNVWGVTTIFSGLAQGLGAEVIFLAFLYVRFTLPVAMLAGAGAGIGAWVLELFLSANIAKTVEFNLIYLGSLIVSGALLAGVVGWLLVRALAATGALSRFAVGRDARRDV